MPIWRGMMSRRIALSLPALLAATPAMAVTENRQSWRDAARNRDLPVLLRLPDGGGPAPLVLLSHGLGGSREGLGYLGRALAQAGFAALHLQHPGTDDSLWRNGGDSRLALAAAVTDASRALDRIQDVVFVLDALPRRPELAGRLDLSRIGIAGHSYGAWLVQTMLGQRVPGGDRGLALPEPRLGAGIALSPIPPQGLPARLAMDRVRAPMLHVTGTEDRDFMGGNSALSRRIPYDNIQAPGQVLAIFAGAAHGSFADEPGTGARWEDSAYHARTAALAVAFLRGVWLGDAPARHLLAEGAPEVLEAGDMIESKGLAP
ncbi:alpha/beta hydrolase family protein [Pseudoroseomonas ludipueritiae]|nr:acetylhydrolase [Pseudoroseomonas ludipueritiae]